MKKKVSFKKGENLVTLSLNSEKLFILSVDIYKLKVYNRDEIDGSVRKMIEDDLNCYTDELQDRSINELVDNNVDLIMEGYDDYKCSLYAETKDDDLIQVEFICGGQCYDELVKLFQDSEPIKELSNLCKKYPVKGWVNEDIINRMVELLNQLDSDASDYGLAEEIVTDYIKQNY